MLRLSTLFAMVLFCTVSFSQDVWLQNYTQPVSGCNLTNNENVQILVYNNSSLMMPSNSISCYYSVDGGPPVSQLLSSNLPPSSSWSFNFTTKANLSACGSHTLKAWVVRAGDTNHSNDTITWNVQNDCTIIPGYVGNDITVCQGANGGTLSLFSWTNGTIAYWQSSINGGSSWTNIANTTASYAYNNVSTQTLYRVVLEGGYCPDDTSNFATISTQAPPTPGTILGSDSLCENVATGVLNLTGNSGAINGWEYSIDNGLTWIPTGITTSNYNYSSLTQTTKYRVQIEGGSCPDKYSDTAYIYVDPFYPQVALAGDDSLCITNANGFITATAPYGPIITWEFSTNAGASWNPLANPSGIYGYSSLTQTTYYRLLTEGGKCPDGISDTAIIYVQPLPTPATLGNDASFCVSGVTGTLNVTGNVTPVSQWEESIDNGASWNPISNNTTSYNYSSQTVTTIYRVLMDGVHCPNYYTNTAKVAIDQVPVMGTLNQSSTICQYETDSLYLSGSTVDSVFWQFSLDNGVTWTTIPNTDTLNFITPPTMSNVDYHVVGINGICPPQTSNPITITMLPAPIVNAGNDTSIFLGDSAQLNAQTGMVGIWMPGTTLTDSTISNPVAFPTTSTSYVYYVIGSNSCIGRDTVIVTVMDPIQFNIRNVLTMNGDNYNDFWNITGIQYFPQTDVKVFNQYGKLVYENKDYKNNWNGDFKGNKLPNGTYYYVVQKGGTSEVYKGTLTLLGNE